MAEINTLKVKEQVTSKNTPLRTALSVLTVGIIAFSPISFNPLPNDNKKIVLNPIRNEQTIPNNGPQNVFGFLGVKKVEARTDEIQKVPASALKEEMKTTQELIANGTITPIIFDTTKDEEKIQIKEWELDICRYKEASLTGVYNNLSKKPNELYTISLNGYATEHNMNVHDLVTGYAIKRPDNPKQTILVFASKNDIQMFFLSKDKKIEIFMLNIDNIKIKEKCDITLTTGKNKEGDYIDIVVFPKDALNNMNKKPKFYGSYTKFLLDQGVDGFSGANIEVGLESQIAQVK